jgi:hypothetical protein
MCIGVHTFSNQITIGSTFEACSANLVSNAITNGWCRSRDDFHFGRCYTHIPFNPLKVTSNIMNISPLVFP